MEVEQFLIAGIENPLLDIQLEIKNDELLTKYELIAGQACLAEPKHLPLFDELWANPKKFTVPGGSNKNSIRAANHMLKTSQPNKVVYLGCIKNDEIGKTLQKELADTGVNGLFDFDEETPTGCCAVIIHNQERALCANLGACLKYKTDHLRANFNILEKTELLYSSAFFITSNYEALLEYAKFAHAHNKPFGYNLAACFLIQFNTDQVNTILEYADFVFSNDDEAKCFAVTNKIQHSSIKDVAVAISQWKKVDEKRPRLAIVTQGKDPVIVAVCRDREETIVYEFEAPAIPKEKIVDTNGAGDAFVGGFLSQIVQGRDFQVALKAGIWLSGQVIQRSGCTFPETNQFE